MLYTIQIVVYKIYSFNPLLFIVVPHHSPERSELCERKSVCCKVYGLSIITLPPITILLHTLSETSHCCLANL